VKLETMPAMEISQAEARLPRWMLALTVMTTTVALAVGFPVFAGGFVLGAALGLLNYFWLHQAVDSLMGARRDRPPWLVVAKFVLRYPLAFGGAYLIYRTGWVSLPGLFAGLFVPAGGILVEAVLQIGEGLRNG